jgi:hypothetical protein
MRSLLSLLIVAALASHVTADSRFAGGNAAALRFARQVIGEELEAIRKNDVARLKQLFRGNAQLITPATVEVARKRLGSVTLEELVASVTEVKGDFILTTKTGHVLTRLEEADGLWYTSLWFECHGPCAWQ